MELSPASSPIESSGNEEPQITSTDPDERILARRLRIQKRNAAAKKRLQAIEDGKEVSSSDEEETVLEKQIEKSTVELLSLTHEGRELITNVRVAADAHEVKRRNEQAAAKNARLKKLEDEANIAQKKFENISSKWENISTLNDPLSLHQETEMQREKCVDLIAQKDKLISELKAELKAGDVRFVKDQQRQADDVSLLVERIDNQIGVMRRAYRRELLLIEQAIDIERRESMDVNNKRWEGLYKQREEDEIHNLDQRSDALTEHNMLMQNIMVHHQEKFRATKISLEKDIQILQQQLEQVKAICLLNKEKMEYNYQVLKKRDEESLLIRSQQKRRINKLQDVVTTLRRKMAALEQSAQAEVRRLTLEVIKLHRNIKDIQHKDRHFCSVNQAKYFQLWKFNHDSAQKLLDKILAMDRLVHEQQLGINWQSVAYTPISKNQLPSYKVATMNNNKNSGGEMLLRPSEFGGGRLHYILEAVADRSGFLIEERLSILLAPYTKSQNTLVRIDNLFNALGVSDQSELELLRQAMQPYIVCLTCQPILQGVRPISPPAVPPLQDLTEEEKDAQLVKKVKDTVEEGERITQVKKDIAGVEETPLEEFKFSRMTTATNTTADELHTMGSSVTPWVLSNIEMTDRSFLSFNHPVSHIDIKSAAPSMFTFTVGMISRKAPSRCPSSLTNSKLSTVNPPLAVTESDYQTEEITVQPHDPTHQLSIHPVFVMKALREFVQKFQMSKNKGKGPVWGDIVDEAKSISRQISDSDVKAYWDQFTAAFPPEREKLWDCLYLGLQKYHSVLQERHKINSEIEQLKIQNAELRHLLQKYALPNNMKPTKGSRYSLPPLSVKTPAAPAPTPNQLILTFNNSSRLGINK